MADHAPDEGSNSSKDLEQGAGTGPKRKKHMGPYTDRKWGGDRNMEGADVDRKLDGEIYTSEEVDKAAALSDDESGFPEEDSGENELDKAHKLADPAKDVNPLDDGRANITDVDEGTGVSTKHKKL